MLSLDFSTFPTLHTERLVLRDHVPTDVEPLFRLRNDERCMEFIGRPRATTLLDAQQLMERMAQERLMNASVSWTVALEGDDTMIGSIGLYRLKPEHYTAEVGYQLTPEHWGKGLMYEALNAVTEHTLGHLGFHRIEAITDPRNQRSRALLERCGYALEGIQRENYYWEGKIMDSALYARLAK